MNNKLKIINYLGKNPEKGYTMHKLSKILDIPYASFYRTVKNMTDLLIIECVGKSKVLHINKDSRVIRSYLVISSDEEKKDFFKKQLLIKKISCELNTHDCVVLFGSYAKETETEQSDIDILIINKTGEKSLSFSKYETIYHKKINPIFIKNSEFKKMLKSKTENIGKQVLKKHIILNNAEKFWGLVLNAI